MMRVAFISILLGLASTPSHARPDPCKVDAGLSLTQARSGLCGFNPSAKRFRGSSAEQARCLLRSVKLGGNLGELTAPDRLVQLAGTPFQFTPAHLSSYLQRIGITAASVGYDTQKALGAEYFVIHDTSSPNCSVEGMRRAACPVRGAFPSNINDASWEVNATMGGHKPPTARRKLAHAWTDRTGQSLIEVAFEDHISHTKFDYCHDAGAKRGLFVGVENIQPRIGRPAIPLPGKKPNDLIAPDPGFSDRQYERLALLYAVASARRGHWLIPAFHAVIDSQYADGHDDPQNFDIGKFDETLAKLIENLGGDR